MFCNVLHGFRSVWSCTMHFNSLNPYNVDIINPDSSISRSLPPDIKGRTAWDNTSQSLRKIEGFSGRKTIKKYCVDNGVSMWTNPKCSHHRNIFRLSGIPQSSVFCHIPFLTNVNDIPEMLACAIKLFADDTNLVLKNNSMDDVETMQNNMDWNHY